jgi:hypothetical protein
VAAGAVVQRAHHGGADDGRRRAADVVDRVAGVAFVVSRAGFDGPLAGDLFHLDHRDTHRRQRDLLLLRRRRGRVVRRCKENLHVGVFVVQHEQAALVAVHPRQLEEVHAVVVAAGHLLGLR